MIGDESGIPTTLCLEEEKVEESSPASSGSGADFKAFLTKFDSDGKIMVRTGIDEPSPKEEIVDWKTWHNDKELKASMAAITDRSLAYCVAAQMWFQQPEFQNLEIVQPVIKIREM